MLANDLGNSWEIIWKSFSVNTMTNATDKHNCDPFWHNESEVDESRTEIWASEVGIGSKNGKRFFQYSQSWIFQGLFPKILSPNPHPKCLKRSCEVGVPLEWARTKASRFGRFYHTCLVRLGHYTFPSLSVLVPTERALRPLSNHRARFLNI